MSNSTIHIIKASGEEELFSVEKLKDSLFVAGAKATSIKKISKEITEWIYPGISTKKIYQRAYSLLRRERIESKPAMLYRLKQAFLELGPTGYPFEALIGQLFKHKGFQIQVGIVVDGQCVTHEMDVIATKGKTQHLVECKYHKDQGKYVSIQVPLYVNSRVEDIAQTRKGHHTYKGFKFKTWVVTNTSFSSDSINYSRCKDINLLAWDYPKGEGLKDLIEKYRLFPITVLSRLLRKEKNKLIDEGIITCQQLLETPETLYVFDFGKRKFDAIMKEARDICEEKQ